jgi:hypothetical protein
MSNYFKEYDSVIDKKREEYVKEKQEKYGHDFANDYIGSAFARRVDTHEEIDANFLRNNMPNKHQAIRANQSDVILADCLKYMMQRSKERHMNCRYLIRDIFPGLPPYNPQEMMVELYNQLIKRRGLIVYKDKRPNTLFISWAPTGNQPQNIVSDKTGSNYNLEYLMDFRDHVYSTQLSDEELKSIILELKIVVHNLKKRCSSLSKKS